MTRFLTVGIPGHVETALTDRFPGVDLVALAHISDPRLTDDYDCVIVGEGIDVSFVRNAEGSHAAKRWSRLIHIVHPPGDGDLGNPGIDTSGADAVIFAPVPVEELIGRVSELTGVDPVLRSDSDIAAGIEDAMAELWERSRPTIVQRMDVIEQAVVNLLMGALEEDARAEAETEAHRLAGSLGTYSFHDGSRIARELELAFVSVSAATDQGARLPDLVAQLRDSIGSDPLSSSDENSREVPVASPGEGIGLLVVADTVEQQAYAAIVEECGLVPMARGNSLAARTYLTMMTPTVGVVGLDACESFDDGRALIEDLSHRNPPVPVIAIADTETFDERLALVRSGASFIASSADDPSIAAAELFRLTSGNAARTGKVLVIDDDETLLASLELTLARAGHGVRTLSDPTNFWEVLHDFEPDALLLDIDMPGLNGYEICRVVRSSPAWSGMPILFLTAHSGGETVRRAFTAGGNDFVAKPPVGPELLARLAAQLRIAAATTTPGIHDAATGALEREPGRSQIRDLLDLAIGEDRPFVLAELHPENPTDWTIRRLRQAIEGLVRGRNIIVRWTPDSLVLGVYGLGKQEAARVTQEVANAVGQLKGDGGAGIQVSAGIAESPVDGATVEDLYLAAQGAREQAALEGPGRIKLAGVAERRTPGRDVDVILVDDDPTLADLVMHALDSRGYTHHWIGEGPAAIESLAGDSPTATGRLILLDVNLPGADGMAVLRAMDHAGVLARSRVLMLTGRTSQDEIVEAMGLGASDHVGKPFSVPVLMSRIESLLER